MLEEIWSHALAWLFVLYIVVKKRTVQSILATYEYYPNNGKLKKINYGNGFSEKYKYNTLEMLEEVWYTYDDGTSEQAFSYTYNHDGTLSVVTNLLEGKDTTKYEYYK